MAKKMKNITKKTPAKNSTGTARKRKIKTDFPRHSIEESLRIPRAILENNAGKPCTPNEAASYCGVTQTVGRFSVEISSSIKYGFMSRKDGKLEITDRARQILRPNNPDEEITAIQMALKSAPVLGDVYSHYRGENIPEPQYFDNTLTQTFKIPQEYLDDFKKVFISSLKFAHAYQEHDGRIMVLDISSAGNSVAYAMKNDGKKVSYQGKSCFVIMPFSDPVGRLYKEVYHSAIEAAGLTPTRADDDFFATGKIIEQIWAGINNAAILVADLTERNPNVFYELGIAHALRKPVVLVSRVEDDVPFDIRHVRVIYYDINDPNWGQKLANKVTENIKTILEHPEDGILFKESE